MAALRANRRAADWTAAEDAALLQPAARQLVQNRAGGVDMAWRDLVLAPRRANDPAAAPIAHRSDAAVLSRAKRLGFTPLDYAVVLQYHAQQQEDDEDEEEAEAEEEDGEEGEAEDDSASDADDDEQMSADGNGDSDEHSGDDDDESLLSEDEEMEDA